MNGPGSLLEGARARIERVRVHRSEGIVLRVVGLAVESQGPASAVGEECLLLDANGKPLSRAQVVGFAGNRVFTMPVDRLHGIAVGARVVALGRRPVLGVGPGLLGRVLDADGRPLDGLPPVQPDEFYPLESEAPPAMERERIREAFVTGVRSLDAFVTAGRGQRLGIFAGSGVGKSTLLGMIARHARADVAVIALVGERGREVRDFLEDDLGPEGLAHAVVFVATSDEPPLRRIRAALAATTAAEYFRDRGKDVVLLMDSITRVAMAQREVGLSLGEPPSTKGYTPSVFSLLPRLVERAGALREGGSVTGLYSVFVEGDDLNDPVADAARSLLDGHVVLSRELASRGHFPAVDVLASVSRLMPQVVSRSHLDRARLLRRRMAALRDAEDLVLLGAYRKGTNPDVDAALRSRAKMESLLVQDKHEASSLAETEAALEAVCAAGEAETEA
jgi:FliI/YscN family ATPase